METAAAIALLILFDVSIGAAIGLARLPVRYTGPLGRLVAIWIRARRPR